MSPKVLLVLAAAALGASIEAAPDAGEEAMAAYSRGEVKTAIQILTRLADQGNMGAATMVGYIYSSGPEAVRDCQQAIRWTRKAADLGERRAQHNLGAMYENGVCVKRDDAQAVHWYELSAAQGDISAIANLGTMYMAGQGVAKDPAKAVELYRKAADAGDAIALSNLGMAYIEGTGVQADPAAGFALIQRAATPENPSLYFNLGVAYEQGLGTAQNPAEALKSYAVAAENGHAGAQVNLGLMLVSGKGTSPDIPKGYMWIALAAEQGDDLAREKLALLVSKISPRQVARGKQLLTDWKDKHAPKTGLTYAGLGAARSGTTLDSVTTNAVWIIALLAFGAVVSATSYMVACLGRALTRKQVDVSGLFLVAGAAIGTFTLPSPGPPTVLARAALVLAGASVGALAGGLIGLVAEIFWLSRPTEPETEAPAESRKSSHALSVVRAISRGLGTVILIAFGVVFLAARFHDMPFLGPIAAYLFEHLW